MKGSDPDILPAVYKRDMCMNIFGFFSWSFSTADHYGMIEIATSSHQVQLQFSDKGGTLKIPS